ncbi:adenylate kinase [Dactylosporangium aurantiacum]|uniref:Adenylate kinase n=1 Tax=Dactylosporangium aurantiacum TaxID=35754 RepID=A0A9Q9IRN1_9ACTN|nr:adenylate kinase [Dactylosporangium aurantiacum]MDG6103261.1 adenylate kinase [Dactylosporangium aurantiacum]UWZ57763.1 adenylate kinase [Dactylosporangium aurantiacum]
MRVLMIAPPGAGKGTQGGRIAAHFGVPHLATGDLLRRHVALGTPLGRRVQRHLDRGSLVPDLLMQDLVRGSLADATAAGVGYVLDGYPRTATQAWAAYQIAASIGATAHVALHLRTDDDEVVRRLLARAGTEHRSDDTEPVIRRRLALYHRVTEPILDWYHRRGILLSVDGMPGADHVTSTVVAALEAMRARRHVEPPGPVPALAA